MHLHGVQDTHTNIIYCKPRHAYYSYMTDAHLLSTRKFTAKNFAAAMLFLNKVGDLAEAETHHPDFHLTNYRDVRLVLSTHAVGGCVKNDNMYYPTYIYCPTTLPCITAE